MALEELALRLLKLFDTLQRESVDLHTFFDLVGGNTPADQNRILAAVDQMVERGWLESRGGDFYARTQRGRQVISSGK